MSGQPPPRPGEVHLWRAPLDVSPADIESLAQTLSADELERAHRLRRPPEAARYTCARGWLRRLIAGYVGAPAASITFAIGEHGKPHLRDEALGWLRFNMSHSGALAVFAVARDQEVGVDVERIRDDVDIDGLSRRFLVADRLDEAADVDPEARTRAFFAMWTRNEAYLKGIGTGLAGGNRDVTLEPRPGWSVSAFDAGAGYAAAVAVEGDRAAIPAAAAPLRLTT